MLLIGFGMVLEGVDATSKTASGWHYLYAGDQGGYGTGVEPLGGLPRWQAEPMEPPGLRLIAML